MKLSLSLPVTLQPYQNIAWCWTKRKSRKKGTQSVWIGGSSIHHNNAYPLSETERKEIIKFMKEHNTDVVTFDGKLWTTTNDKLVEVSNLYYL